MLSPPTWAAPPELLNKVVPAGVFRSLSSSLARHRAGQRHIATTGIGSAVTGPTFTTPDRLIGAVTAGLTHQLQAASVRSQRPSDAGFWQSNFFIGQPWAVAPALQWRPQVDGQSTKQWGLHRSQHFNTASLPLRCVRLRLAGTQRERIKSRGRSASFGGFFSLIRVNHFRSRPARAVRQRLTRRSPSSQRCHHRCTVAGDTLKAAAAAFSDNPRPVCGAFL